MRTRQLGNFSKVIYLNERDDEHRMKHGEALLLKCLEEEACETIKATADRPLTTDPFVEVWAPASTVDMFDVPAGTSTFAGVDKVVDIDTHGQQLRVREAENHFLALQQNERGQLSVVATKNIAENAVVAPGTSIKFTSEAGASKWLHNPQGVSNALYSDRVVTVNNLKHGGEPATMHCILVGVVGEVNAAVDGQRPNCVLECTPGAGPKR